jgi:hypothetical protein
MTIIYPNTLLKCVKLFQDGSGTAEAVVIVRIAWVVPIAVGRTHIPLIIVPRTTTLPSEAPLFILYPQVLFSLV